MKWLVIGSSGVALLFGVVLAGAGVLPNIIAPPTHSDLDDDKPGGLNDVPVFVIPVKRAVADVTYPLPPAPASVVPELPPDLPTVPSAPVRPFQNQPPQSPPPSATNPGPQCWGSDCRFESRPTKLPPQQVAFPSPEAVGPKLWLRGDYLLWWTKGGDLPPLVTTGPQNSLGILGRPGTRVLAGGEPTDIGPQSGFRLAAGAWLDECRTKGIEVTGFFLCQADDNADFTSNGQPLLARPFLDAVTGRQNIQQVANLVNANLPNLLPLAGSVAVSNSTYLWGLEANTFCGVGGNGPVRLSMLGGLRFLQLNDRLAVQESLIVPQDATDLAGTRFVVGDEFRTRNDFYGGQVGARIDFVSEKVSLQLAGKVGLGAVRQAVDIQGGTLIDEPGQAIVLGNGGLLALPTNSGHYGRNRFAVLPEGNVKLGYNLTSQLRCTAGYTILYLSNVVRPGDQIDLTVNPSQLPPGNLSGAARPAFHYQATDFWAQGINFGLEYVY